MPRIDATMSLAEIVTMTPAAAPIFESLGLDYCCHGAETLEVAVGAADLDLDVTIARLEVAQGEADVAAGDWTTLSLAALADHIESTHHAFLHDALPRLCGLAERVAEVHGERHPELTRVFELVWELRRDLEPHLMKEERMLFPMVRELDGAATVPDFHCGSITHPIRMMTMEHQATATMLEALRDATNDYTIPDDACASYHALYAALATLEADTHLHIHKENNVLFPAAREAEAAIMG